LFAENAGWTRIWFHQARAQSVLLPSLMWRLVLLLLLLLVLPAAPQG